MSQEETPAALVLPNIHLNGTGRKALTEEYAAAHEAVREARKIMGAVTVHGRDYYTHENPSAYTQAREKHREMLGKLDEVAAYLHEIRLHLHNS